MKTELEQTNKSTRKHHLVTLDPIPAGCLSWGTCTSVLPTQPPYLFASCVAPLWPLMSFQILKSHRHPPTHPPSCPFRHFLGASLVPALSQQGLLPGSERGGSPHCPASTPGEKHPNYRSLVSIDFLEEAAQSLRQTQPQACTWRRQCLLLAASRSQTRMEPDWEPATMSSSGVLRRTLSTGDV